MAVTSLRVAQILAAVAGDAAGAATLPNGSSMRLVACHLHTGGALPPELTVGAPS